ncbi:hypothetical protein EDE04_3335 [Streptomyces sp. 2132.2]|uniref:hypothetical protein n=1 Tax=Streptomyces sp. 2132.2 TaxID=2485161 RepID=UPI000F4A103F|nr:hypothetical protein [Streptomyces sp. 2132.2]ROQ96864.1 hypothetical protein EDE04_3335 [Streptomyces sp. 2132.2]
MDASQLAELRTMYVFTPMEGQTWGLTYDSLKARLLERDPDEFIRIQEGGAIRGSTMHYGITLEGEELEGYARVQPEGISILDSTVQAAANFVAWLREHVVPEGVAMTFNTVWGLEEDLPDVPIPEVTRPRLVAAFLAHLEATGLE